MKNRYSSTTELPCIPLVCLQNAKDQTTTDVIKGKNTVIDFWTTRCTRCPAALDRLNEMAADPAYGNVHFVAIVCDSLDGARNIIEQDDEPRWANLQHYFMSQADKERAKKILGFHSVPFYVVVNERGVICQKGNKVDWDTIPGFIRSDDSDKENDIPVEESIQGKQIDIERLEQREFVLDDLDF